MYVISCSLYSTAPGPGSTTINRRLLQFIISPAAMNGNFLITGAAGGFGKEFSRRVLEGGGRVVLTDKNSQAGTELCQAFQQVPT